MAGEPVASNGLGTVLACGVCPSPRGIGGEAAGLREARMQRHGSADFELPQHGRHLVDRVALGEEDDGLVGGALEGVVSQQVVQVHISHLRGHELSVLDRTAWSRSGGTQQ